MGFSNGVLVANNVDFTGNVQAAAQVTTNGQLLIGSSVGPNIRVATLSPGAGVSITNGPGTITIGLAGGGAAVETLTGNSGGAVGPTANNINILGTGSLTIVGTASTLTPQLTGLTNHAVLVGAGTATITKLSVGTTGQLLVGASAADPAFASSAVGDFTFTSATAGATRTFTVSNTDNTNTASNALIAVSTGGASAGDAYETFSTTTTTWAMGVDNSPTSPTADPFVISLNSTLGTNNVMSIDTAGAINYPLQPAFLAWLATNDTNATGNGAVYTLGGGNALTEVFDQGNNLSATGVFTAPVTGRYFISGGIQFLSITAAMTWGLIQLSTSNRTYQLHNLNAGAVQTLTVIANTLTFSGATLSDMDAADTFSVTAQLSSGVGNTATVGGTNTFSRISGYLSC
jgi:hypothetical protein